MVKGISPAYHNALNYIAGKDEATFKEAAKAAKDSSLKGAKTVAKSKITHSAIGGAASVLIAGAFTAALLAVAFKLPQARALLQHVPSKFRLATKIGAPIAVGAAAGAAGVAATAAAVGTEAILRREKKVQEEGKKDGDADPHSESSDQ